MEPHFDVILCSVKEYDVLSVVVVVDVVVGDVLGKHCC